MTSYFFKHVDIGERINNVRNMLTLYNYMTNIDSNDVRKIAKLVNTLVFTKLVGIH